jgi:peptidase E
MAALAELERRQGRSDVIEGDRAEAMEALRELDRRHADRIREAHEEWEERIRPGERPSLAGHREEVAGLVRDADALTIAGGHVAVLINRLRLFDVLGALREDQPVVAWSGGAMCVTEHIVFYHDSPPQGPGNAEVFESGLRLARNLVALPHASRRLRLDDGERVSRFCRRFAPATSVVLGDGAALRLHGKEIVAERGIRRLLPDGTLEAMA